MAQAAQGERQRETLDEFTARNNVGDHFEQAAFPELERRDLPTIEHPDSIAGRQAAQEQDNIPDEPAIKTDVNLATDFSAAEKNETYHKAEGEGSQQVKDDAPEHNVPPPDDSKEVDRKAHNERMAQDDRQSNTPQLREDYLEQRMQALKEELQEAATANDYDRNQDHDRGQDYGYDR